MGFIYRVTNTVNGKIYVGKTTLTLAQRIKKHQSVKSNPRQVIQLALLKYGFANFKWEILEEIPNELLDSAEIRWIFLLNSTQENIGYNRSVGGDGGRHSQPDSKETRLKKSIGMLGNENAKGKRKHPVSEEHRNAISKAMRGKKGRPKTQEEKDAISKFMTGRKLTKIHKKRISEGVKRSMILKEKNNGQ